MRAVVYTRYGPPEVLQIREVEKPVPKSGEVLIRVHAATVNRTDCGFRSAKYFVSRFFTGLLRPKREVAGSEFAGEIAEVGEGVTEFASGDGVLGFEDVRSGAHAEYMTNAAAGSLAAMPEGFGYQELAPSAEGATYALCDIRAAGVEPGQKVMVYGASGAIGTAAVQILKHMGAEVTAVCGTANVELVRSLGADRVVDYQTEDFTRIRDSFDFVFDAVGKTSFGACRRLLGPRGKYCSTELGAFGQNPLLAVWFAITRSRRVIFPVPRINKENTEYIARLVESGAFKPVVDRIYALDEIVSATRYVETGQKVGNVVISVSGED
ncbi:NAD(P)-dependent alcohol dehydrogenase [Nocardiopsis oceani]